MYLSIYHFDGEPTALAAAYDRLASAVAPGSYDLHACVTHPEGISVYDACPTLEIAHAYAEGPAFRHALQEAGLPQPRVERVGEIHAAWALGGQVIA